MDPSPLPLGLPCLDRVGRSMSSLPEGGRPQKEDGPPHSRQQEERCSNEQGEQRSTGQASDVPAERYA